MQSAKYWDDLVSFVREQTGTFDLEITKSTLIEEGLGCTGDDGYELITAYSKLFQVDISGFVFRDYFYPEPGWYGVPDYSIKPLTVGDLLRGIYTGVLNDSVIGRES